MIQYPNIVIRRSNGRSGSGKKALYIRPSLDCANRSRKITGWNYYELQEKLNKVCEKWYAPMIYYEVNGDIIGSNSKQNALKEYWKVCSLEDSKAKKPFEIKQIQHEQKTA